MKLTLAWNNFSQLVFKLKRDDLKVLVKRKRKKTGKETEANTDLVVIPGRKT